MMHACSVDTAHIIVLAVIPAVQLRAHLSSKQMGQVEGGSEASLYCVPQVAQIQQGISGTVLRAQVRNWAVLIRLESFADT